MKTEITLVDYVLNSRFESLAQEPVDIMKNVILTVLGTLIAGVNEPGTEKVLKQVRSWGGKEEATVLVHGGKFPAPNAVMVNSFMARAIDFCDAIQPGMHVGSTVVPVALAAAEMAGGCTGRNFLNAVTLGTELACRLNSCSKYGGFDATGICAIFASTAAAGRILKLNPDQLLGALGIAFNKSAGSFQSNVEGVVSVLLIQGFTSQSAMTSIQLAQQGLTGPQFFIEGTFGYLNLFGNEKCDKQTLTGELGTRYELKNTLFKKYPSCGLTQSSTAAILDMACDNNLSPDDVGQINIAVQPFVYDMVGHPYKVGDNPKVNAQYSIPYCVANALLNGCSKIKHFSEPCVTDAKVIDFSQKVRVTGNKNLEEKGQMSAMEMEVITKSGKTLSKSVVSAPGFPGNPLKEDEHISRFWDCIDYSPASLPVKNIERLVSMVKNLEDAEDVREIISLITPTAIK